MMRRGFSQGALRSLAITEGNVMFGSIDILIGLVVVFLAISMAVSALTEIISHHLQMRPQQLKKAMLGMLDGAAPDGATIPPNHWFFNQTLLRSMADSGTEFPSYLDRKTFGEALLLAIDKDFAGKKGAELVASLEKKLADMPINAGVRQLLINYARQSEGDALRFQALAASWFDRVMDRATGWYKRNTATIGLVLAAVIVFAGNIDTLAIAGALRNSDALRAKMVELAGPLAAKSPQANTATATAAAPAELAAAPLQGKQDEQRLADLKAEYESMRTAGLPLGWAGDTTKNWAWITKFIGLLITVCAATLGAPFWFDMLSKVTNIRSAGPKPQTKTDVVSPPVKEGEH
jgi:hypothetical protein